jgi:hypothetical protein
MNTLDKSTSSSISVGLGYVHFRFGLYRLPSA